MKLSKLIFQSIFWVAFISIFIVITSSIFFQYRDFQAEKMNLKEQFMTQNKELIKNEVNKVITYIEYQHNRYYSEVKERLTQRVNDAYNIAMAIYNQNKNSMSKEEIQYLIVTALRNISFSNHRSYYFINSNQGDAILYNTESKLGKNENIWQLQDKNGTLFIQKQANIARSLKSGFVKNYFVKPDQKMGQEYPKLSFVKLFEPYDWHIGMGEYIDDMQYRLEQDVLEWISTIRFGNQGYIYVNTLDGHALVFNGQKLEKPKYWGSDSVFKKEVDAALNKENHYFYYKFRKLDSMELSNKLGYVVLFDDFQWLIGSGIYIDEITYMLKKKRDELNQSIVYQILFFIFISIILTATVYYLSKRIQKFLDSSVNYMKYTFDKASKEYYEVNTDKITFKEFQALAKSLNKTLKSREEVQKKLRNYLKIVDANVITFSIDKKGFITEASKAMCKVSSYTHDELVGQHFTVLFDTQSETVLFKEIWRYIKRVHGWSGEIQNVDKKGEIYWLKTYIHANFKDKEVIDYTIIAEDITDKKRVEHLSITDGLTQLFNRRYFNEKMHSEINRVKRSKSCLAFMMIDVDYFKMYNDTYGHLEGDEVLKEVANVLRHFTKRSTDFAFRLGGEEFGLLFECERVNSAEGYANKIKESIENLKIKHMHSHTGYVTVSIGLAIKQYNEIQGSNEFYKCADKALYEAKQLGRNQVIMDV